MLGVKKLIRANKPFHYLYGLGMKSRIVDAKCAVKSIQAPSHFDINDSFELVSFIALELLVTPTRDISFLIDTTLFCCKMIVGSIRKILVSDQAVSNR